jgi:signal transduction histidine kinase
MAASADKMATLEQAISQASVDSPTVTTGDKDLRSIEVALNGLLRQMQEAKLQQMRFVSDASHELRTPIAVIQGYVNMLDRWGATDQEVLHESIEALKAESEHMQELVEQLLFLARGDSGRNTLQHQPVNLADVVRDVYDESVMIDEGHLYACSIDDEQVVDERYVVTGDLAMLKQVVRIIVQNAEKYSSDGTTITLGVSEGDGEVLCTVQDEGIGMSEADAAHVFERFYRADGARSEGTSGSGLGLSIAKWIVDAHGGSIEVLSREGVGTRFTVHIPR